MYDCGLCSVRKLFDQWKLLPSTVLCVCKVTKRGRIMLCCYRWHEAADFPPPPLVSGSFMIFNCWWVGNQQQKIFLFLLGIYLDLKKKMLPHCLISSWLNDKSMKKKLLCEGEGKQHHGTLYCLYQGRKCKWLLTSHWRDRSKWLLWGNWGNMGFFFSSICAKLLHVWHPSWLSSTGDGHRYHVHIYSRVWAFDTKFCQAEKRSVFLQKDGGFDREF